MGSNAVGLPPGFKLDDPSNDLPAGFKLDEPPKPSAEKPGMLSRIWDLANSGLVSPNTILRGMTGKGMKQLEDEMRVLPNDSPIKAGIKTFIGGSLKDTAGMLSGMTSPIGLGLTAAGGVGTAGKAGIAARGALGAASVYGIGKGAADVIENAPEAIAGNPDAAQKALMGGSMLAGGTVGIGAIRPVRRVMQAGLLGRTPEQAYESALKPSTAMSEAERARIVDTGLAEGIPISKGGLEKLGDLISDVNQQIKGVIASDPNRAISPAKAVFNLRDTKNKFATQVNPKADIKAINQSGQEFLDQFRSRSGGAVRNMTAAEAQAMKQGTYRVLGDKSYGEMGSASKEAQKALARGLKEELANAFPELKGLNARDSRLLDLAEPLERAVARQANHQFMGIGTPAVTAAAKAVTGSNWVATTIGFTKGIVDNPYVKSRLAIAVAKGGKISHAAAMQKINAYSGALLAASENADKAKDQSTEPPAQ